MKVTRNTLIGFMVLALCFSLSTQAFAKGKHNSSFVKLLQDSSAALQSSRPDLSAQLKSWADEEAAGKNGKKEPKKSAAQRSAMRTAHVKLLQDSASALKSSHPDLAKKLDKAAARRSAKKAKKKS